MLSVLFPWRKERSFASHQSPSISPCIRKHWQGYESPRMSQMDWTANKADVLRLKVVIGLCTKHSDSHLGEIETKLVLYAVQFILTISVEHNSYIKFHQLDGNSTS